MSSFSLGVCPGVELLDHMVVLFSVFQGPSVLLSTVAVPAYIPTNGVQGFPFPTSLPTFVTCVVFDDSHFDRYEVIFRCGFDLHFSDD